MQLRWADGLVRLDSPTDFKAFKVVIAADAVDLHTAMPAFGGIATFDGDHAWVDAQALRDWRPEGSDPVWRRGLEDMIEKARPHGWIHPVTGAIRAHVVFEPVPSK